MSYLPQTINGFTIMAHTWAPAYGYVVMGFRKPTSGSYEYVVAYLMIGDNPDTARCWSNGTYYYNNLPGAMRHYQNMTPGRESWEAEGQLEGSALV